MSATAAPHSAGIRMNLSSQIAIGLALGIGTGLFFGEPAGALGVLGDAFVKLLQMTVLPYIIASLIAGLGKLEPSVARMLAVRGGLLLLMLWALAFGMVALTPLAFPDVETASFYSTTLVSDRPPFDFVGLYIPSNPFHSMANELVPGVVLFSIAIGIALLGMPDKQKLIDPLEALAEALRRVSGFVVRLMPLGVFAIAASAAGTMQLEEAQRIQIYVVSYVLSVLGMSFLVLPGIVAALTPIPFREVASLGRGILLTAFATGSEFIVLPQIADRCKELIRKYAPGRPDAESLVDVFVPVAFSFPHVAKILSLAFVPFGAWFAGTELSFWDYPVLAVSGIVSLFGSINLAMPFLLNLLEVPEDLFQLFLATGVINARFGTLLAAVHILALTLLACCAIGGGFQRRWLRALLWGAGSFGVIALLFVGCRVAYVTWFDPTYSKRQVVEEMQLRDKRVEVTVQRERTAPPPLDPEKDRLAVVRERGLRVCYAERGNIPMGFFNASGELVGFDAEMAHSLAHALRVDLTFVPVEGGMTKARWAEALRTGACDLGATRSVMSLSGVDVLDYSHAFDEFNVGFLTRDSRRREFARLEDIEAMVDLRIAMPDDDYYYERMHERFPQAQFTPIESLAEFFEAEPDTFDAMITLAEIGSAWTLRNPEFSMVVPKPLIERVAMAYTLPSNEPDWANTVNTWIRIKRADGTIQRLYDYWILGIEAESKGPRWSIIRDVLGWVD